MILIKRKTVIHSDLKKKRSLAERMSFKTGVAVKYGYLMRRDDTRDNERAHRQWVAVTETVQSHIWYAGVQPRMSTPPVDLDNI